MKTTNEKAPSIVKATVLSAMLVLKCLSYSSEAPAKTTIRFHMDNAEIKKDVTDISCQRGIVKDLEAKIKNDHKTNNAYILNVDRKNLTKAEADLKKSEAYLAADKKDFEKDYRTVIKHHKKVVRHDRADLRKNKRLLLESVWKKDEAAIRQNADKVAFGEKKLKSDKEALAGQKANKKADMALIKNETKKSKEELRVIKSVETAYADTKSSIKGWFKRSKKI